MLQGNKGRKTGRPLVWLLLLCLLLSQTVVWGAWNTVPGKNYPLLLRSGRRHHPLILLIKNYTIRTAMILL